MVSNYSIGPGVKQAIADNNDEARSSELYRVTTPGHEVSETYARDAIYYYYGEDNRIVRLPFDV